MSSGFEAMDAKLTALAGPVADVAMRVAIDTETAAWYAQSQELVPVGHPDPLGREPEHPIGALKASGKMLEAQTAGPVTIGAVTYGDENTLTRDGRSIAIIQHEGASGHEIVPVNAPFLHFFWEQKGVEVRALHVSHPGTKPLKYLESPVMDSLDGMGTRLATKVGEGLAI